jgi:hypothetical protein
VLDTNDGILGVCYAVFEHVSQLTRLANPSTVASQEQKNQEKSLLNVLLVLKALLCVVSAPLRRVYTMTQGLLVAC